VILAPAVQIFASSQVKWSRQFGTVSLRRIHMISTNEFEPSVFFHDILVYAE